MNNTISVYIARHGITSWNQEGRIQGQTNDIPLSEEGKVQMKHLGKYLEKCIKNPIVVLSPLIRTQESFNIINKSLNVSLEDIYTLPELIEMNFGIFEGRLKKEIASDLFFTELKKDKYKTSYPEGESYEDVYNRLISSSIGDIFAKAKVEKRDVLFVGHESTNRIIPLALAFKNIDAKSAVKNRQKNNEIVIYKYPFTQKKIEKF